MRKANLTDVKEESWSSPSGKFHSFGKTLNDAIDPDCLSTDLTKRHPFEVELSRIPPCARGWPYHWHSLQWEFYLVLSGEGQVRDEDGTTAAKAGDFFMFGPGQPHQISNPGPADLIYYVIANNSTGDTCYYPDSDKWAVGLPGQRKLIKGAEVGYHAGEDEVIA